MVEALEQDMYVPRGSRGLNKAAEAFIMAVERAELGLEIARRKVKIFCMFPPPLCPSCQRQLEVVDLI